MLKNIFYVSIILAVLDAVIFLYFTSDFYKFNNTQWFSGFYQILAVGIIMAALVIWWIVYFSITKDFYGIWIPLVLVLLIVGYFAKTDFKINSSKNQQQTETLAWLAKAGNKQYQSVKLGISFDYISQSQFDGTVGVEENGDVIHLTLSGKPQGDGSLKVFKKDAKSGLLEFLKSTYAKSYPKCRFYPYMAEGFDKTNLGFPASYSVVVMYGDPGTGEGCPQFGIEYPIHDTTTSNYFVMDAKQPDKYIFLTLPEYPVEAYKPQNPQDFPPKWFETIEFH